MHHDDNWSTGIDEEELESAYKARGYIGTGIHVAWNRDQRYTWQMHRQHKMSDMVIVEWWSNFVPVFLALKEGRLEQYNWLQDFLQNSTLHLVAGYPPY